MNAPASADPTHCLYRGAAHYRDGTAGSSRDTVALSTCDGYQGLLVIGGQGFALEAGATPGEVAVSRLARTRGAPVEHVAIARVASAVAAEGRVEKADSVAPTKYLELVMVSDAAEVAKNGASVTSNALQLANVADALYRNGDLGTSIAITLTAHLAIATASDPYTRSRSMPAAGADASSLLDGFGGWAATTTNLPKGDEQFLVSGLGFESSVVGLTFLGGACGTTDHGIVRRHVDRRRGRHPAGSRARPLARHAARRNGQ